MKTRGCFRGFTLIEILVAVIIIGTIASLALLSLGVVGDDRELQTEARRVISLLEVAQDEASTQGREFGLELLSQAYRFVEFDPYTNQWGELLGDETFRQRQLPQDAEFELYLEDQRILLVADAAEFEQPDARDSGPLIESYAPHILIFSSGDMTPFELHILKRSANQRVVMRGDLDNVIEIVSGDD